mmetsp:Transcript_138865/g.196592  ORF Transcript_138865/g.196592 Transcript_138865/m.196592 type:complete len:263 (+) Transcript_138865:134-922(+)
MIVEARLRGLNWDSAFRLLRDADPLYAKTVAPNDWRRLERALNIIETSGQQVSSFQASTELQYDFRCVYLTAPRLNLYANIDRRCEQMVADGLIEEVIRLIDEGLTSSMPGAGVLGYRQSIDYLHNEWFTNRTKSIQRHRHAFLQFLGHFQAKTRQFARKQASWFRNNEPKFVWFMQSMNLDGSVFDVEESGTRIAERFMAPNWVEPSGAECTARAKADCIAISNVDMAKYNTLNTTYTSTEEIDLKISAIRKTLHEYGWAV